eukprot:NODE_8514_length_697_cov_124.125436_g8258_i0.p2 GENE.NODE_8514_length_697_cov_124.125436_g8258_i0~~NODE_8514_length_697_cov_124.125436_g8258_i0.p2  ORF type:complete len:141 (-),score=38.62 NODE_8514_length_697_cov_124.125436_g8258_i0:177-599(-)
MPSARPSNPHTAQASCAEVGSYLCGQYKSFTNPAVLEKNYTLIECNTSHIHGTHATKAGNPLPTVYVDDQWYDLSGSGSQCTIAGRSESRSKSIYDYDTNFCNMWNVFRDAKFKYDYDVSIFTCPFHPSKGGETGQCNKY